MRTLIIAAACLVGVIGVPTISAAQSAAAIEHGKKVYADNKCQVCHSIGGTGNKRGPLDGVGKKLSAEEIRLWMTDAEGMTEKTKAPRKPLMRSYPKMSKEDLDALVAYMQSLK
jgi:mono/diheme cytochrome c family protein